MSKCKKVIIGFLLFVAAGIFAGSLEAAVKGACVNCHTMHNSQDGQPVVRTGVGAGWDTGVLSGGDSTAALPSLLVSDCVGCHTNAGGAETIVSLGGSDVPIVLNTSPPTDPPVGSSSTNVLAGGNFYWVWSGADNKGHNVFGISGADGDLSVAPGSAVGCVNCHGTLSNEDSGCNGCHYAAHHLDSGAVAGSVVGEDDGWYRFLSGENMQNVGGGSTTQIAGVIGIEDAKWEQNVANTNTYKGTTTVYVKGNAGQVTDNSIGDYCAGCHSAFHSVVQGDEDSGMTNASGAWIRHPSDVALPGVGTEYDDYEYTAMAPVAYTSLDASGTAVVTCISCHRPHGSSFPDMLRWDYENCRANNANSDCGCFACHTTKDGVAGFTP